MQHQSIEKLQIIAEAGLSEVFSPMTRAQRLERWAELLEREPTRRLAALPEPNICRAKAATWRDAWNHQSAWPSPTQF